MHGNRSSSTVLPGVAREVLLCPRCLTPFHPLEHYCRKCGEAVGQYTPYIPFVNIPFNMSIYGAMWKRLWSRRSSLCAKAFYVFLILAFAPIMFVGLPFVIAEKLRKKRPSTMKAR
jgi:hypothetical protein